MYVTLYAFELLVGVNVRHGESALLIGGDIVLEVVRHSGMCAIVGGRDVAVSNVSRDAMVEAKLLHVKEIHAESHTVVVLKDVWGDGCGLECGHVQCWEPLRMSAFDVGDVGAVDINGPTNIVNSDRAVQNVTMSKAMLENRLGGPTELAREDPCTVRSLELPASVLVLLTSYGLKKRIGRDRGTRRC